MKAIILSTIMISLMIGAQSVYASKGFYMGSLDAQENDTSKWTILEPGEGFAFHSSAFVHDYIAGFCSVAGPSMSSDADQASWDCTQGPDSGSWVGPKGNAQDEYNSGLAKGESDSHKSLKDIVGVNGRIPAYYEGWLDGFCHFNPNDGASDADEMTYDCSDVSSQQPR